MEDNRSMDKCVILIALIACSQAILWAEGRQLKFMENEETAKHGSKNINLHQNSGELKEDSLSTKPSVDVPTAENTVSVTGKKKIYPPMRFGESAAPDTDDFRPTAPGNSPGVGHKHAKQEEEEDFLPTNTDDFRPTTPGNSPGAGHKHAKQEEEEDFLPTNTDDFRPTTPGNSPGAGHKRAKEEEDFRPTDTDDFRPTAPGNSPGVGHKHAKEEEEEVNSRVKGDENTTVSPPPNHADDFRPTAPGNSPRVRHAIQN